MSGRYNGEGRKLINILVVFGIFAAPILCIQERVVHERETLCPGALSLAPGETAMIPHGDHVTVLTHKGKRLGPDELTVNVSTNVGHRTTFAGTFPVYTDGITKLAGLGWQGRGSREQSFMEVGTATEDNDACIVVTLNE